MNSRRTSNGSTKIEKSSAPAGNARVQLGQRVRELRKRQNRTLEELGRAAGFSKSTMSKIENGTLSVSYDNLLRLARALAIEVSELFAELGAQSLQSNSRRSLARKGAGDIYENDHYRYEILCGDLSPRKMVPMVATLRTHSRTSVRDLIRHTGEEFVYVLEGRVEVHCEFYSPVTLEPGDGLYFDSAMGHTLLSSSDCDAKILWMATSEPTEVDRPQAPIAPKTSVNRKHPTKRRTR